MLKRGIILLLILLLIPLALAHEEEGIDLNKYVKENSVLVVIITSIIVTIFVLLSVYLKNVESNKIKALLFLGIVIPAILASIFLIGSTIYLNVNSETKGPVHWHADFEIWNCGENLEIIDPTGISNRVGNPVLHEHGDNRMHVEGVLVKKSDASLHHFFEVINGNLYENGLTLETNNGIINLRDGDLCNNSPGKIQVFVYKITNPEDNKNWIYKQSKLENFEDYILSPYSNIPPGDCIIIEFDQEKTTTNNICETYSIAIEKGELNGS